MTELVDKKICSTCKHWDIEGLWIYGSDYKACLNEINTGIMGDDIAMPDDFGCKYWEPKDKDDCRVFARFEKER